MADMASEARVKYGFPKKPKSVYLMYLEKTGKSVQDMKGMKKDAWKKELSKQTMAAFEAKSQEAKKKYETETRAAATKAIREQNWMALRVRRYHLSVFLMTGQWSKFNLMIGRPKT